MRKGLFISAILLPVVLIVGGVYLIGLQQESQLSIPDISKSKQAGSPSAAKPGSPSATKKGSPSEAKKSQRKTGAPDAKSATAGMAPVLDVARIDPKGASVFAGRAEPYATVTVFAADKAVGNVKADEFGEWALLVEKPVTANENQITLKAERQKIVSIKRREAPKASVPKTLEKPIDSTAWVARKTQKKASASKAKAREKKSAKAVTSRLMRDIEELVVTAQKQASSQAAPAKSAAPRTQDQFESAPPSRKRAVTPPRTAKLSLPAKSAAPRTQDPIESAPPSRERAVTPARTAKLFQPAGKAESGGGVTLLSGEKDAPTIVPFPIKFVFREATFTPEGGKAAKLLLTYVKLKNFKTVTLSGHADERGSELYNVDLSRQRLETVSRYLADGGFEGKVVLIPKGESEPFQGVDRRDYPREELYQLDRRVELDARE